MRNLIIPEGTEKIGNHWFWGSMIESVMVPASVREIGTDAFYGCVDLKCVNFAPESRLEKVESTCFCNSGIERIAIPKGVEEIPIGAFESCKSLKEVVFETGSTLKKIGDYVFWYCTSLRSIQFPDCLETIGRYCFSDSCLEDVVIPASVKNIEPWAFKHC